MQLLTLLLAILFFLTGLVTSTTYGCGQLDTTIPGPFLLMNTHPFYCLKIETEEHRLSEFNVTAYHIDNTDGTRDCEFFRWVLLHSAARRRVLMCAFQGGREHQGAM
jgi:hypothetical protein